MKTTVNFADFVDTFVARDRLSNFGYDGLRVLFDYLEEYEEDTGEEIELDVIALCCEYALNDWVEIATDYDIDLTDCDDEDESIDRVRNYLADHTALVGEVVNDSGTSFIYGVF